VLGAHMNETIDVSTSKLVFSNTRKFSKKLPMVPYPVPTSSNLFKLHFNIILPSTYR
jgi:hypothetical protein